MKNKIYLAIALTLGTPSMAQEINKANEKAQMQITVAEKQSLKDMRIKWVDFLTGNLSIGRQDEATKKFIIDSANKNADKAIQSLDKNSDRKYLYSEYKDMKNGVHVQNTYENIKNIAKAYVIPGTKYYQSPEAKKIVLDSMEWLYTNAYHEGLPEYGNWWQWELGIPKNLNEIVAMMYEEIPVDKRIKYLKASQYFQPYARYSGYSPSASYSSSPEKRISTGGNRMDTAIISFARGILMEDPVQVIDGASSVADVGELVTEGDGFYSDGSFVQHGNIAYNGTYASVLFNGLGSILYLSKGTPFEVKDSKLNNVYDSIINGYSYLFINGGVTDIVSGRSISRDGGDDLERGRGLITSMAMVAEGAPSPYKEQIKDVIKVALTENNKYKVSDKVYNLTIKEIINSIQNDSTLRGQGVTGNKIFWGMDRAVGKNSKGGKVAIAMHSSRIGNYETMNGENQRGWYTGDGMTYIYGKDSAQYSNFWPTVDPYHLPGTTESINERKNKSGERRHKIKMSPKAWVGGSSSGEASIVGMDFLSWNDATKAKKSWFMVDDVVIALGSNISSRDGEIHTTIDNRILRGKKENRVTIDGTTINLEGNIPGENFGYKILGAPKMTVKTENRTGTWKEIGGKSDVPITETYFTAYIDHGKNPNNEKYSYIIMPMFSKEEIEKYDTSSIKILQQDENAHAIRKGNIVGINFWKDTLNKVDKFKTYSTLSLLSKENDDNIELWISDPTQLSKISSTLEIDGKYSLVDTDDKNLKISHSKNKTILKIDTTKDGSSKYIKLKK